MYFFSCMMLCGFYYKWRNLYRKNMRLLHNVMSFCLFNLFFISLQAQNSTESLAERKLRIQRETRCIELKASGQIQQQQQAITMLYVLFNFTCKSASHSWGFHRFQIQIFTTSTALSQPSSLGRMRPSNEEAG